MNCSKCLSDNPICEKYAYFDGEEMKKVSLCHLCNSAYTTNLLVEFMKEDFGLFPVSEITKSMINARKERAKNQSPWKTDSLNTAL